MYPVIVDYNYDETKIIPQCYKLDYDKNNLAPIICKYVPLYKYDKDIIKRMNIKTGNLKMETRIHNNLKFDVFLDGGLRECITKIFDKMKSVLLEKYKNVIFIFMDITHKNSINVKVEKNGEIKIKQTNKMGGDIITFKNDDTIKTYDMIAKTIPNICHHHTNKNKLTFNQEFYKDIYYECKCVLYVEFFIRKEIDINLDSDSDSEVDEDIELDLDIDDKIKPEQSYCVFPVFKCKDVEIKYNKSNYKSELDANTIIVNKNDILLIDNTVERIEI